MIKAQQNQLYLFSFECSTAFAEKNATCSALKNYWESEEAIAHSLLDGKKENKNAQDKLGLN